MANVRNGNTWSVDTASSSGDATSYIADKLIRLTGVIYTAAATGDVIRLYDKGAASGGSQGSLKLKLSSGLPNSTTHIDLSTSPVLCPNGMWVGLTGTPTATFIISSAAKEAP